MLQLQPDNRRFQSVIGSLVETGGFYDTSEPDYESSEEPFYRWRGMLKSIPCPIDTKLVFIYGANACLVSIGAWYLLSALKNANGGYYDVDLCHGDPYRVWSLYQHIQSRLLNIPRKNTDSRCVDGS